jgi:hypothetical protein
MRKLMVLAALAMGAACSLNTDPGTGRFDASLAGTYALQTIDGAALPFSIVAHDTTVVIDTDVLVLDPIGSWAEKVNYHQTIGAGAAVADSLQLGGFWSGSAGSLGFRTQDLRLLYVGTATDTTLVLSDNQYAYVFKR